MSSLTSPGLQSSSAKDVVRNWFGTTSAKWSKLMEKSSGNAPNVEMYSFFMDKQQAAVKLDQVFPKVTLCPRIERSLRCCRDSKLVITLVIASSVPKTVPCVKLEDSASNSFGTLKSLLSNRCEKVLMQMKADLKKLLHRCSLTCDVWSDKSLNNSYLGVTLHYCDQAAVLRRVFLGLSKLTGPHTGDLIRRETEIILDNYRLPLRKVFKVVTDGGSNMVKGFRDIISIDVCLQWLDQGECGNDEEDEEEYQYDSTLDLSIQSAYPLRIGCFAHALQLVIMTMFKKNFASHSGYQTFCALTNQFRRSTTAKEELKSACGKQILLSSNTRWASQIVAIGRFLEIKEYALEIAELKNWEYPTESEIKVNIEDVALEQQLQVGCDLNSTLDQLLGEVAIESRNSGSNSSQISANSLLDQMLHRVRSATTVGRDSIDALNIGLRFWIQTQELLLFLLWREKFEWDCELEKWISEWMSAGSSSATTSATVSLDVSSAAVAIALTPTQALLRGDNPLENDALNQLIACLHSTTYKPILEPLCQVLLDLLKEIGKQKLVSQSEAILQQFRDLLHAPTTNGNNNNNSNSGAPNVVARAPPPPPPSIKLILSSPKVVGPPPPINGLMCGERSKDFLKGTNTSAASRDEVKVDIPNALKLKTVPAEGKKMRHLQWFELINSKILPIHRAIKFSSDT
uniref:Uncharacterized protein n=1 Tax=Ditylenchus dipsaci TaxID=166011 RepID=A0A915D9C1_9BILA